MGLIYFDSCLLIYLVERHERYCEPLVEVMSNAADAKFCLSPLTKSECLVGPLKRSDTMLKHAYLALFDRFLTVDMPETVFLNAAELKARFGLKTPDALHLACAQYHSCSALWTNDDRLNQAGQSLACDILHND